jgi:hypothetical protein
VLNRGWALASPLFLVAVVVCAAPLRLSELVWNGSPTTPSFRGIIEENGRREVELRPATRADPVSARPYVAFYRLAVALGSRLVPRAETRAIPVGDLIGLLSADPRGLAAVKGQLRILNDGTVMALLLDAAPRGREVDWNSSPEVKAWRAWVEGRARIPEQGRPLGAAYVEALVLDYLAGNLDRRTVRVGAAGRALYLLDNATAFPDRPDNGALDVRLAQLRQVTRFPRGFAARLRAFDPAAAEDALHQGGFATWLVSTRPIVLMMERRRAVLSLVEARVAEIGEDSALSLP